MEIRCRKGDCNYNTGSSCKAKSIHVCKKTAACETYDKDESKKSVTVEKGKMFESTKSLPPKNTNNVPLSCSAAECLFNKKENCIANGIVVVDAEPGTRNGGCGASCATYIRD